MEILAHGRLKAASTILAISVCISAGELEGWMGNIKVDRLGVEIPLRHGSANG